MKCLISVGVRVRLSLVASHSPHGLVAYLNYHDGLRCFTQNITMVTGLLAYSVLLNKKNTIKKYHIQIFEIIMLSFDCLKRRFITFRIHFNISSQNAGNSISETVFQNFPWGSKPLRRSDPCP